MTLVVRFMGKTVLPAPGANSGYLIWTYSVEASPPGELPALQRIALGLPSDMDVQNPDRYPGVPQLAGTFLQRDPATSRQYVGRVTSSAGSVTISFVAPAAQSTCEMLLVRVEAGQPPFALPFATATTGPLSPVHVLISPALGPPVFNGRPVSDFAGTLPYASEVFGIYQPLAGLLGMQNTMRAAIELAGYDTASLSREMFTADAARTLDDEALAELAGRFEAAVVQGVLSPVGLVNLFRQYFFEFDTFLGPPAGHLWISPGGTVEVVETSTRRTLVEKTAEQTEETSRKTEESLTQQDDVADAVKEENANDTKLGVSATGGVNAGIYHADASASFSTQSTVKSSSEQTHKQIRTQSAKVSSEIKRNFKTTFKTVTETTDTSSRRYVVQNTTNELVNYELRRKVRKVGVQLQHIGTRLSWQVYFNNPGRNLGLGDMVDIVPAPDLTALKKPEQPPPLQPRETTVTGAFPIQKAPSEDESPHLGEDYTLSATNPNEMVNEEDDHIVSTFDYVGPPPGPGYRLSSVHILTARTPGGEARFQATPIIDDTTRGAFRARANFLNFGGNPVITLTFKLVWQPPEQDPAQDQFRADLDAYHKRIGELQQEAYGNAVRNRLKLVSSIRPRPAEDLRSEERHTVFAQLIGRLGLGKDPHLGSELIRQYFDVDEMLYFVAPDFWRPRTAWPPRPPAPPVPPPTKDSLGRYPVPAPPWASDPQSAPGSPINHLKGETVASWYSQTDVNYYTPDPPPPDQPPDPAEPPPPPPKPVEEWRVNYLITEETQPAPMGSSLGWIIQIDGDERRNEFLNAAWAKAVLPVRPGHEVDALKWLAGIEGQAALGLPYPFQEGDPEDYQNKKVGEVLEFVAADLEKANKDVSKILATEEVFETGFDPLAGGFRPAAPYQVFDQWVEILPTDQVVAVQVRYDPKTGQQL